MDAQEVRLRCLEAAAKTPAVHKDGHAAGVQETAAQWAGWVLGQDKQAQERSILGLPKKK